MDFNPAHIDPGTLLGQLALFLAALGMVVKSTAPLFKKVIRQRNYRSIIDDLKLTRAQLGYQAKLNNLYWDWRVAALVYIRTLEAEIGMNRTDMMNQLSDTLHRREKAINDFELEAIEHDFTDPEPNE